MKKYEKYTFFYKMRHPFSNWHQCTFEDSRGTTYSCSEQYMMAEKARLFGDEATRLEILATGNPSKQKELGRKVRHFDSKIWNENAKKIVYEGCKLKFTQNHRLLKSLLDTEGTLIVEASPYDRIWGIGLAEDDPDIHDPLNWNGLNWLGEVLTQLRDDLLEEE